jgi:PPOX class probable F420-dependent enzyme
MPSRRNAIALSPQEIRTLMETERVVQVASINPDGTPHLAPMWFILGDDDSISFTTYGRSQKIKNLERDSRVTLLTEAGHEYNEIIGVSIDGTAEVIREPKHTANIMKLIGLKHSDQMTKQTIDSDSDSDEELPSAAYKRVVVKITPKRYRSWDHGKV